MIMRFSLILVVLLSVVLMASARVGEPDEPLNREDGPVEGKKEEYVSYRCVWLCRYSSQLCTRTHINLFCL